MSYNQMFPREFLDELMLNKTRELHSKIELLDWQERVLGEIQGRIVDGSLNVDGTSVIRRTCSLSMIVDDTNYDITSLKNEVALNKKVRIYVGLTNFTRDFQRFGKIVWFPLGVYVLTESSIQHNILDNTLSLTAQDKMCLLSGEVGGQLQSPVELHRETFYNEETGKYESRDLTIYDIIKFAVVGLGEENPAKVLINDVPLEIKEPIKYKGDEPKYFDMDNNEVSEGDASIIRVLNSGDYAGYRLVPFVYPTELIKQAGDSVASILEDIKNVLGNYEYFYDVHGNFVFQEVKNFTNTQFTPITELSNGQYVADFAKVSYIYSFKEKDIISSYNNTPSWSNIKNDFVVWGVHHNEAGDSPIMYHLAIDEKPFLPPDYNKPWQQFIVERGDLNPKDGGKYYQELKGKLPQIYDAETNTWKGDSAGWNYYFDLIDSKSELGKYSVASIGRRTKAIVDENVTIMYPPEIPDIVILEKGVSLDFINSLIVKGMKFQIVEDLSLYTRTGVGKDAFTVIRELLYQHTTFNEVINISCLPLYHLEVNHRIEAEDKRSNISGDYVIKSMSLPLNTEAQMTISAIRVSSRI